MIAEGRVTLNGEVLASPAVNVGPGDRITVDGEPLPAKERTRLWLFHKPRGTVTTARDPEGRPTVFEQLPEEMPRAVAIGRLDINTEGLLLLTNDGGLAKVIAHPDTGWLRRYRVRAHGDVEQADLDKLADGVTVDGMEYGPVEARLDRAQGDNVWITLGLREGKNREVKRILEQLGLQVNRLIRLSFGPFQLGDLEVGLVEEVRTKVLKEQLGAALAAEAGVDFESPVREPIAPFGAPPRRRTSIAASAATSRASAAPSGTNASATRRSARSVRSRTASRRSAASGAPARRTSRRRAGARSARIRTAPAPRAPAGRGSASAPSRKRRPQGARRAPRFSAGCRRSAPPARAAAQCRRARPRGPAAASRRRAAVPRPRRRRPARSAAGRVRRQAAERSEGTARAGAGGPRGAKRPPGPKGPPRGRR